MGTTWSVKFVQPTAPLDPERVARAVGERLEELERVFSTYRPDSELSQFNANGTTGWIDVAPEIVQVAAESRRISELTNGAFDVTVAPLVGLWGFGLQRRAGALPSEAEISDARRHVGWRQLESRTEPPALRKAHAAVCVDFSSIAKGFAADELGGLLASLGATQHFVQIGGDVKASGSGPAGDAGWRTGIEEPSEDARSIACIVELLDQALSTSGDYRNFFTVHGRRYGHIIDPRTGAPAASALAAVSVIHSSCATSSGLATALFVLGPEEGYRLAAQERIAAIFFTRERGGIFRRMTAEFETRQSRGGTRRVPGH